MYDSLTNIVNTVAHAYKLAPATLLARTRRPAIVEPRHVVMYLAHTSTKLSLIQIGNQLGEMTNTTFDHTTVLYGREKVAKRMLEDLPFAVRVAGLQRAVEWAKENRQRAA